MDDRRNDEIRSRIADATHAALIRLCGGGVSNVDDPGTANGNVAIYSITNGSGSSSSSDEWHDTLNRIALSSVSFPNGGVHLAPLKTNRSGDIVTVIAVEGKPHDIEVKAALNFYHRYKPKGKNRSKTVDVISDMGIVRTIESSLDLANRLASIMEDYTCGTAGRGNEGGGVDEEGICDDVRSNSCGIICMVTRCRAEALRNAGKLPCPDCIKWCKGEKGLWWHQQMEHGNVHSSATAAAAAQTSELALVPYNRNQRFGIVKAPVESPASVKSEKSPLDGSDGMELAKNGDLVGLIRAVENGFDPRSRLDRNGSTALMWAAGSGHSDIVSYLLRECACDPRGGQKGKRSYAGRTPLHWAARNGRLAAVRCLVEHVDVDVDATTADGTTAFCWASWQGHLDVMRFLLDNDCDPHRLNVFGCNAVLWCAQGEGDLETFQWLKSVGCEFCLTNFNGHGFLHKAAQRGKDLACKWYYSSFLHAPSTDGGRCHRRGPAGCPSDRDDATSRMDLFGPDSEKCCPSDLAGMEGHLELARWLSVQERGMALQLYEESLIAADDEPTREAPCFPKWLAVAVQKGEKERSSYADMQRLEVWEAEGGSRRMVAEILTFTRDMPRVRL